MRDTRLTRRGWVAVTAIHMAAAFAFGLTISQGEPCDWTVTTAECAR